MCHLLYSIKYYDSDNRTCLYNGGQYAASQPDIDAYRALILLEAQKVFELMVRDLTSRIINNSTATSPL